MKNSALENRKLHDRILALWPAIKGSLAQVHKPCIRDSCPACASGQKHSAWLLSFTHRKRRKTMYVPQALVPALKKALTNGRRIEAILYQAGPDILKRHRLSAKHQTKPPSKS